MKRPATGYRVDLKSMWGFWMEYTSLRKPVTLEMAEALFEHLQRNKTAVRIVDMATGKTIKEGECGSTSEKK